MCVCVCPSLSRISQLCRTCVGRSQKKSEEKKKKKSPRIWHGNAKKEEYVYISITPPCRYTQPSTPVHLLLSIVASLDLCAFYSFFYFFSFLELTVSITNSGQTQVNSSSFKFGLNKTKTKSISFISYWSHTFEIFKRWIEWRESFLFLFLFSNVFIGSVYWHGLTNFLNQTVSLM